MTPRLQGDLPGVVPGDGWCVVAVRWLQAYNLGVSLSCFAATSERALDVVPLHPVHAQSVDVPTDPRDLR
nr:DUF2237 family protein [Nocardioides sp. zg-1230]